MKPGTIRHLAVALLVGATVSAGPAEALQCPKTEFERARVFNDELPRLAADYAARMVSRSSSIFHGHVVAAKFLGEDDFEHPQFLITYKVDRWLKGSRSPYAHVVRYFWCDGACHEDQIISDLIHGDADGIVDNRPKLHFFDPPSSKNRHPNQRLDGLVGICDLGFGRSFDDLTTERRRSDYKTFLLEVFLQQEVEKLM